MRLAGFGVRRPKQPGLGSELSGVVEAVGPGVTGFRPGDEVYGVGRSTLAQYAVADAKTLARKPSGITHAQAGSVPTSGVTALQAVRDHGHLQPGQSVLVIGASGGVGSFAVQIARALGGHVTGVPSTGKLEFVRSLGAEHVIDYTAGDITQNGRRYDVVLDIAGEPPAQDPPQAAQNRTYDVAVTPPSLARTHCSSGPRQRGGGQPESRSLRG